MAKRKFHAKRSSASLPKGLPQKRANDAMNVNPFDNARASFAKKAKFEVHNRNNISKSNTGPSTALQRSLESRKKGLKEMLKKQKNPGSFVDRRIGEKPGTGIMSQDERMLARVVRERVRRSKKTSKFTLDDDEGDAGITLTHKGQVIDENYDSKKDTYDDVILSDDEDARYGGQLDKMDTEMHFGGGAFDKAKAAVVNPYGPSDGTGAQSMSMGDAYRSRKNDLDEMIRRRKIEKAEKVKKKEKQVDTFEGMDENFDELRGLLQFRDKEKDRRDKYQAKQAGTLSDDEKEMDDWNKEVAEYHLERKVKATDRTKSPEEVAKEESDRLHEQETRRMARMNGDFEDDDLSDISDDDTRRKGKRAKDIKSSKKKSKSSQNPDELDSDSEDDKDELEARFTPDGLVYVDKDGKIVKKFGEDEDASIASNSSTADESAVSDDEASDENTFESDDSELASLGGTDDEASAEDSESESVESINGNHSSTDLLVGTKVIANYRAEEQFGGKETWHAGTISKVHTDNRGNTLYDIEYVDGDTEDTVLSKHIGVDEEKTEENLKETQEKEKAVKIKMKRQKAKEKARKDIPYVFEVPTTLDALHEMIGNYASTGKDACLIIDRIHASNSVRLNKRNQEKMQNYYDVLLRRFVGVGDALYDSGDGGSELSRYDQLNSLTATLYQMAQDSPTCAGAVWGRRLGIFQKALAKRLRDAEFVSSSDCEDQHVTAWHSTGTLLLLRVMGHIFPVTDLRHVVVTPSIILLGQTIAQTPVGSLDDLCRGLFCCSLMIEYCKEATRLPSEALSFLSGTLRLFSDDLEGSAKGNPLPSLQVAIKLREIRNLRVNLIKHLKEFNQGNENELPKMSLEKGGLKPSAMSAAIFGTVFRLIEASVVSYSQMSIENEVFEQTVLAILCLNARNSPLPRVLTKLIAQTGELISSNTKFGKSRQPLARRISANVVEVSVQSLAPRMEDPTKYVMSRDKGKTQIQAERDRIRREYRREHKAVARELRLDATYIETERRKDRQATDNKERTKRQKNHNWLEQEQATINQQVRKGGEFLKGGGTGVARIKAASGKLGIKKGGKF